ncbi:hypothetical protein [Aurantibacter sp.]|uniref:hypothetical protein n=1 Tax=Aurantibacter sp. TaxID=2807103 RepID=UPI003266C66A
MFLLKKSIPFLMLLLIVSCSKEEGAKTTTIIPEKKVEPIQPENTGPTIQDQVFTLSENPTIGTSIGTVLASDQEADPLTFTIDSEQYLTINATSGELQVSQDTTLFDFETVQELEFEITVSDAEFENSAIITLNLEDEEDGPLTNYQKEVIYQFKYMLLYYESQNPEAYYESIYKREGGLQLFLDGNVTDEFEQNVAATLETYNALFTDGMEITIVSTLEEANVHVYHGPVEAIKDLWPFHYDYIVSNGFDGYAAGYQLDNGDYKNTLWVNATNTVLFSHELGHLLALSHSDLCYEPKRSMMCASSLPAEPLPLDYDILRYLYHPDVYLGMPATDIDEVLTNIMLNLPSSKTQKVFKTKHEGNYMKNLMTY